MIMRRGLSFEGIREYIGLTFTSFTRTLHTAHNAPCPRMSESAGFIYEEILDHSNSCAGTIRSPKEIILKDCIEDNGLYCRELKLSDFKFSEPNSISNVGRL